MMPMDKALKKLLKQTVTIETFAGRNDANEFTYNPPVNYACRIEKNFQLIKTLEDRDVVSDTQIYVDGDTDLGSGEDVNVNFRVTLPDGEQPEVLNVQSYPDETGQTYYKCIWT